mmetsp:Transcript_43457/g.131420  ORF Transcript_43457/g.131420 Transcript_43457/m.131420 type:complete len:241 (+) Transcript_43457:328-1050(+)
MHTGDLAVGPQVDRPLLRVQLPRRGPVLEPHGARRQQRERVGILGPEPLRRPAPVREDVLPADARLLDAMEQLDRRGGLVEREVGVQLESEGGVGEVVRPLDRLDDELRPVVGLQDEAEEPLRETPQLPRRGGHVLHQRDAETLQALDPPAQSSLLSGRQQLEGTTPCRRAPVHGVLLRAEGLQAPKIQRGGAQVLDESVAVLRPGPALLWLRRDVRGGSGRPARHRERAGRAVVEAAPH